MAHKMSPARRRAYEMFEEGEATVEEIARAVQADRSTVYRYKRDWEAEASQRAAEAAQRDPLSFLKAGFDQLWRWPKGDRPWVLAVLHRLDEKLVFRDPDAEPPADYDPADALGDLAFADHRDDEGLDRASEVRVAGVVAERAERDGA